MSSMGQGLGFGLGYILGGSSLASIGGMIGLWLDPADPPDPPELGDLGNNSYVRNMPVPIAYGENKIYGGVLWIGDNRVEMEDQGSSKQPEYTAVYYADFAVGICEGIVPAYITFMVNEKTLLEADEDDSILMDITLYTGTGVQTVNPLISANVGVDAIPFVHTAYIVCSGKIGKANQLPTFSCIATCPFTMPDEADANPVQVLYDFLRNPRYGLGISIDFFDGDPWGMVKTGSWTDANDFCNVMVSNGSGGYEPRFRYSNAFINRMKAYDIITDILQTCRGYLYYSEGLLKIKIGQANETPVLYFGDNYTQSFVTTDFGSFTRIYADFSAYPDDYWKGDVGLITVNSIEYEIIVTAQVSTYIDISSSIVGSIGVGISFSLNKQNIAKETFSYSKRPTRDRSNRIRVEFINRADSYRQDYVEDDDTYDIYQTDEIREQTTRMEGIKRKSQAARMACFLKDASMITDYLCEFQTDIVGYFLTIGDIIGVTHAAPNWVGKLFRIVAMEELEDFNVKLSCLEYNSDIYHDGYTPLWQTPNYNIPNPYEKPDNIERLLLFEDSINSRIYITFKKPDNNPYWVKGVFYLQKSGGEYVPLDTFSTTSPSVKLLGTISSSDTIIPYDASTIYSSFPSTGTFFIESELIYYTGIDDINDQFTGCTRGYNGTTPASHDSVNYCVLISSSTPYYTYTADDISLLLTFKGISVNIYDIYSASASAPTASITVSGYYYYPEAPTNLQINGLGDLYTLNTDEDAVLTWNATGSDQGGYGRIYGDGTGYGGGSLSNIEKYKIEVYVTNTGVLVRTEYVTDTATPTFTYTVAMNYADNTSFESNLTFKVYQIDFNSISSVPAILVTNGIKLIYLNSYLVKSNTVSTSLDAYLMEDMLDLSLDALLNKSGKTKSLSLDAYLVEETPPVGGWTITSTFESGTVGNVATGSTGFNEAGDVTIYDNTRAQSGTKSCKMTWINGGWNPGDQGFTHCKGWVDFPENLVAGDEIWARGYFFFPTGWSWSCSPVVKILRLTTTTESAHHVSIFANWDGYITLSNEPGNVQTYSTTPFGENAWVHLEIYVKFSSSNNGIIRIWKDGVLILEDTTKLTIGSGDYCYGSFVMSTWNSGPDQAQSQWIDNLKWTTSQPTNQDAYGNYMIGPD